MKGRPACQTGCREVKDGKDDDGGRQQGGGDVAEGIGNGRDVGRGLRMAGVVRIRCGKVKSGEHDVGGGLGGGGDDDDDGERGEGAWEHSGQEWQHS